MAQHIVAYAYMECSAMKMQGVRELFHAATKAGMLMKNEVGQGKERGCMVS
jgi:hypothetical protein